MFLIIKTLKNKDKYSYYAYWGFLVFILLPTVGIIISYIFYPIFGIRYLIPLLGIFWLSISLLVSKLYTIDRKFFIIFVMILLIVGSINIISSLNNEQDNVNEYIQENKTLHEVINSNDILIFDSINLNFCPIYIEMIYFFPDNDYYIFKDNLNQSIDSILQNSTIESKINNGSKILYITRYNPDIDIELSKVKNIGNYTIYEINSN